MNDDKFVKLANLGFSFDEVSEAPPIVTNGDNNQTSEGNLLETPQPPMPPMPSLRSWTTAAYCILYQSPLHSPSSTSLVVAMPRIVSLDRWKNKHYEPRVQAVVISFLLDKVDYYKENDIDI